MFFAKPSRILRVDSAITGANSVSRQLTERITGRLAAAHPDAISDFRVPSGRARAAAQPRGPHFPHAVAAAEEREWERERERERERRE